MNIDKYVQDLPEVITHEHLASHMELINKRMDIIKDGVAIYEQIWNSVPSSTKEPELDICIFINRGIKANKGKDLGKTLAKSIGQITANLKTLDKVIEGEVSTVIVKKGITLRQTGILINLETYFFWVTYTTTLIMNSIKAILRAASTTEKDAYLITPSVVKGLNLSKSLYILSHNHIAAKSNDFSKALAAPAGAVVTKANSTILHDDLPNSVKGVLASRQSSNFAQSPILWIRRSFIGMFEDSYSELEEQRRYLELSLRQLENEKKGESSPAILKEMETVEDRIVSINYKMKQIMKGDY